MENITVEQAKEFLKQNGYYVDNLWHVDDVYSRFDCTEEEAQEILDEAMTNEATMERVWFSIEQFKND